MCAFQSRFSSICTPKYLYDVQRPSSLPLIFNLKCFGIFLLFETIINFDFLIFKVSLLEASQMNTFSNSELTSFCNKVKSLFWAQRNVSSAKRLTYKSVAPGKSLTGWRLNRENLEIRELSGKWLGSGKVREIKKKKLEIWKYQGNDFDTGKSWK